MSDALSQMAAAAPYADAFELRLDLIHAPELAVLLLATPKPIIATCRPAWEGGGFRGSEQERMEILSAASLLGADYVDIELDAGKTFHAPFLRRQGETGIILSHHVPLGKKFDSVPVYRRMRAIGADVMKFAFCASDAWENRIAFDFLLRARKDRRKAVAIAMGEAGEASRVLYRVFGGWGMYAAAEDGRASAPGQVTARQLKELYRADRLSHRTKIFGVVGYPVSHSRGIFVHNPLFALAGKDAVYCRFPVKNLRRFMSEVGPLAGGFSVTLPQKKGMLALAHTIDPVAKAIGAVNTMVKKRNGWWGTNTDAAAALDAIEHATPVAGKRLLVLGAGGAARAIAFEAARRGAAVSIANRTASRARALARELRVRFQPLESLTSEAFDIFANATSVGMAPRSHQTPVAAKLLRGKVVFDAVYNPPLTRMLKEASQLGATIVPGTEMYVNQGAAQFKLYTGVKADIRAMKRILLQQS
jgi:3-dehydroquinate dehydratase / shikimate dehydrogenase